MKLISATIRNFRRLEEVTIDIDDRETVFVGPNNSGKTSATAVFRTFLGNREFSIHDFSVGRIAAFDAFGSNLDGPKAEATVEAAPVDADPFAAEVPAAVEPETDIGAALADGVVELAPHPAVDEAEAEALAPAEAAETTPPTLPEITLDLWFKIDPESIAFGRVYTLLQTLSEEPKVGLRLTFGIDDPAKLLSDYAAAYPSAEDGTRARTLFDYLSAEGTLSRYGTVRHFSLREAKYDAGHTSVTAIRLAPDEGKRLVKTLVRAEFVDAQRNISDDEGMLTDLRGCSTSSTFPTSSSRTWIRLCPRGTQPHAAPTHPTPGRRTHRSRSCATLARCPL